MRSRLIALRPLGAAALLAGLAASASGRRSDLGGRKPVPVLQDRRSLRAARGGVRGGARRAGRPAAGAISSGAPSAASTIPTARTRRRPTAAPRPRASAISRARLGWAAQTARRDLLREQAPSAPLSAACERKYSWGTREGGLRPARGAHGRDPHRARAARRGASGDCTWIWQPRRPAARPRAKQHACNEQAHHRARALFARSRAVPASSVTVKLPDGRELAEPTSWSRTSSSSRWAIPSPPAKAIRTARCTFSAAREMVYDPALLREEVARGPPKQARRAELRARLERRPVRPEGPAAPAAWRTRTGRALLRLVVAANSAAAFDKARRAVAQRRLPPLAIRLSVPRRHPARAGEPPSRGDAAQLRLLGRRSDQRPVPRHGRARGLSEPRRQGAARSSISSAISSAAAAPRPHAGASYTLPITSTAAPRSRRRRVTQALVPAASSASARSTWCCCRSAATTSASARSRPTRMTESAPTSRRSPA